MYTHKESNNHIKEPREVIAVSLTINIQELSGLSPGPHALR